MFKKNPLISLSHGRLLPLPQRNTNLKISWNALIIASIGCWSILSRNYTVMGYMQAFAWHTSQRSSENETWSFSLRIQAKNYKLFHSRHLHLFQSWLISDFNFSLDIISVFELSSWTKAYKICLSKQRNTLSHSSFLNADHITGCSSLYFCICGPKGDGTASALSVVWLSMLDFHWRRHVSVNCSNLKCSLHTRWEFLLLPSLGPE